MQPRPTTSLLSQRLVALCLAGGVLLDFPLLKLALGHADAPATMWGLPALPLLLFAAWALLIVLLAWLMESAERRERAEQGSEHSP